MSDSIVAAVARLEKAGQENARATKRLHEAATIVAEWIEDHVPARVTLPRGYRVAIVKSNVGSCKFLVGSTGEHDEWGEPVGFYVDGTGSYLHGDFHAWVDSQTRDGSLKFARDVADGLLTEISEWLEKRATESDAAAATLENSLS